MRKHTSLGAINRIHFIGIGGVSMSGIAETLVKDGFIVSGADRSATAVTSHLQDIGIHIDIGYNPNNITPDIDLVVYNAAIKPDNPERMVANTLGIPSMVRAELIGKMLQDYEYAICIAGSHGKTSTTALVTAIAVEAGLNPTVNIGGYIGEKNYLVGNSPYFILESCEYSNSYHHFHPYIGVILNIDADHMDFHGSMDAIIESFAKFARNIRPGGTLIIQKGIQGFDRITEGLNCKIVTFDTDELRNTTTTAETSSFELMNNSGVPTHVNLPLPGEYNMHNALAAFTVGRELGVEPRIIAKALSQAQSVRRRYEYKGELDGTIIIDDYAHHPTEIKACLAAARAAYPDRRIICIFQPHTYTRTRNHFDDFSKAFSDTDIALFVPIYAAREPYDPTISSEMLSDKVGSHGHFSVSFDSFEDAEVWLREKLIPYDLLITMGAGDVYLIGERLLGR
ncbi:MAG: UDP-N-acetylmuramate--L-alanine ligase [Defluviitaleaceae bacterium]|nr:UDP-N-acetylmuramate--L-alanine ligase [Defluviitaleaceae bacterium]